MSTLFTNEEPKPFGYYPPTWAYVVALVIGIFSIVSVAAAPAFAYKWPSEGWRWGLWMNVPGFIVYFLLLASQGGALYGLVSALTSPSHWLLLIFACVLAFASARFSMSRQSEQ
jgi:hypothetical protein